MPRPKRQAKIDAKRERRRAQHENHHAPAQDTSALLDPNPEPEVDTVVESEDNLDDLTKDELKDLAEDRDVPSYGTKADIIQRLREDES